VTGEAPGYPEYGQVLAAASAMSPFISPAELAVMEDVARRRGPDWCASVTGAPFGGLRSTPVREARMLVVADGLGLTPPAPGWLAREREAARARAAAAGARAAAAARRDAERWAAARAAAEQAGVPVEVRVNAAGATIRAGAREHLAHVVPLVAARSSRRVHPAGRPLCEAPGRARPLVLGEPTARPATCVRCLDYAGRVTPSPEGDA
jgi:hypothetical protein